MTTSAADMSYCSCLPTGIPRPSSLTETEPSSWIVMSIVVAWPACASSTELSTTS